VIKIAVARLWFIMHRPTVILFALCSLFFAFPYADAQSQTNASLPKEVQQAVEKSRSVCKTWTQLPGFVTEKDINGDGIRDFILDYDKVECDDSASAWCGSAGCLTQVFASLSDGTFVKVLDGNVRGLSKIGGRSAMSVDLHGSACGRAGAAPCAEILYWNGQSFSPAN
jgi:hypothetical protein